MITAAQEEHIKRHAYLPEHVPEYVTAISQAEPFLFGDYLVYGKKGHIIVIGYPFIEAPEEKRLEQALDEATRRLKPESISLIAPVIPPSLPQGPPSHPDYYYRLDLSSLSRSQKLRNMVRRAQRDLAVGKGARFDREHREMVDAFLASHSVDQATGLIFRRIDAYLSSSTTASILEARTGDGGLVAFDIADFRPRDYALYMFNFRSQSRYAPGASDLLLAAVIQQAAAEGKKYINLGLGINPGVIFFKRKWGSEPFLPYAFSLYRPPTKGFLEMLLQRL